MVGLYHQPCLQPFDTWGALHAPSVKAFHALGCVASVLFCGIAAGTWTKAVL